MDNIKNTVYMLLSLNKDEDHLFKSVKLNHPIAIKFLSELLAGERTNFIDIRGDKNGRIKLYKINDSAEAAFIKISFGFSNDNKAMRITYSPRVISKELYSSLIKENDINKIINTCESIAPECEMDMFVDTTSFIESE